MQLKDELVTLKAHLRLLQLGDFKMLTQFSNKQLMDELDQFKDQWKPYNPRKKINRWGLSVTSIDGKLSGIPDLDSLGEYNRKHNTKITNQDITTLTPVYDKCPTLQKILEPWKPFLTRCHFIRLDQGGFFPEHIDCSHPGQDPVNEEVRLIGMVNNCHANSYKFIYENKLKTFHDGTLHYFNANKEHCVFSTCNNSIQLIIVLNFKPEVYNEILRQSSIK